MVMSEKRRYALHVDESVLHDWETRIAAIDKRLRPIAYRPMSAVENAPTAPLDEAGVRDETEALLAEMIAAYRTADDETRERMRKLFAAHSSFAWGASFPFTPLTKERFRDHLTLFSLQDQNRDTRDAMLALDALCDEATRLGIAIGPHLDEGAALSSDVDLYGMGSTKTLFLQRRADRERDRESG